MLVLTLSSVLLTTCFAGAVPTATNIKDGGQVAELPDNWDQTKEDAQSLFFNKNNKNDLEPYPLALSEEGPSEGIEHALEQGSYEAAPGTDLDNLVLRPALYGEQAGLGVPGADYESRRRKRGSGTKVGGAGAATKVATKAGSGKKNLKDATPEQGRQKRDSGLNPADVRALLAAWEAQEQRRKIDWNNQWADRYYGRGDEQEDAGDIWYNEPVVVDPQRDLPHSYFSEQNRLALSRYPDMEAELAQRYEEARRKRQYLAPNKMKRFMVAKKRSEVPMHQAFRPRDDLYTLAELLRAGPRVHGQDVPIYRRLVY